MISDLETEDEWIIASKFTEFFSIVAEDLDWKLPTSNDFCIRYIDIDIQNSYLFARFLLENVEK